MMKTPTTLSSWNNAMPNAKQISTDETQRLLEQSLASVRDALADLKFGMVALTVHDGRVVQIDVTEKRRLNFS